MDVCRNFNQNHIQTSDLNSQRCSAELLPLNRTFNAASTGCLSLWWVVFVWGRTEGGGVCVHQPQRDSAGRELSCRTRLCCRVLVLVLVCRRTARTPQEEKCSTTPTTPSTASTTTGTDTLPPARTRRRRSADPRTGPCLERGTLI